MWPPLVFGDFGEEFPQGGWICLGVLLLSLICLGVLLLSYVWVSCYYLKLLLERLKFLWRMDLWVSCYYSNYLTHFNP